MISSTNLLVLVVLLAACFVAVEAQWGYGMPYGGYGGYGGYGMGGYGMRRMWGRPYGGYGMGGYGGYGWGK